jgi:hypothetical protein
MYVVQGEIGGGLYDGDKGSLRTVTTKMWASSTASGGHQRLADPPRNRQVSSVGRVGRNWPCMLGP